MASYAINLLHSLASNKSRVDSFDSVDSFDVVSVDESIEECSIEAEDAEMMTDDDANDAAEWEDVAAASSANDDDDEQQYQDVQVEMHEGFELAIGAALEASILGDESGAKVITAPRRRSAREALRDFYLSRAKTSEESSKNYRTYEPEPIEEPVAIAPLRAPERYDVEVYERAKRLENARKAELALRDFYAQRDAEKAKRALENRANERFVYQSQIGSSGFVAPPVATTSCVQSMYWETTRFVISSSGPQDAALST